VTQLIVAAVALGQAVPDLAAHTGARMYGLVNTVENLGFFPVYCAYSAKNPDGGADIWKVSVLDAHRISSQIDIDYIRACSPPSTLCWSGIFGTSDVAIWKESGWVKLRQMVTTTLRAQRDDRSRSFLTIQVNLFGEPTPALAEAKKYDTGWHVLGSKETRGTEAVKQAIAEWEDIIKSGSLSALPVTRAPGY